MKTDLPPTPMPEFTEPPPSPPAINLSRLGMWLLRLEPATVPLCVSVQPGWGSPLTILGGLCLLVMPPVALLLSLIGLVHGRNRGAAIAGMLLSGLCLVVFFGMPLLIQLCR